VVIIAYLWASGGGGRITLTPLEALAYTRLFFAPEPICDNGMEDGRSVPASWNGG
jgi:hypothetical protein